MAGIGVRLEVLNTLQSLYKLSNGAMALKIGVDKTMLWRIKTGRSNPGVEFIAKFLKAFPEMKFEDVFFPK